MKKLDVNEAPSFNDFLDEGWIIFFVIFKGFAQALTGIVYFVALILYFLCQGLFLGSRWAHKQVKEWTPQMPTIFKLEENA